MMPRDRFRVRRSLASRRRAYEIDVVAISRPNRERLTRTFWRVHGGSRDDVGVRTVLIVANKTIGGNELSAAVAERLAEGPVSFHLLVPVPPPRLSAIAVGPGDTAAVDYIDIPDSVAVAEERLTAGLQWLRGFGVDATGEVGSYDAVDSVTAVVARGGIDEVLVSTLPSRVSRWLKQDLPCKLAKAVDVPVSVVTPVPAAITSAD
jgi:hypothetical protein